MRKVQDLCKYNSVEEFEETWFNPINKYFEGVIKPIIREKFLEFTKPKEKK